MPRDIAYDFFASYASADNRTGWVDAFLEALVAAHQEFTGGRTLTYFLDRHNIQNLAHWHAEIFNKHLVKSRFFLAFLSPNYFASEICRKEWKCWIDQEIALHLLASGAAPVYFVEVPGFLSKPKLKEHEVAAQVAQLCGFPPTPRFVTDLSPILTEARRRQTLNLVLPFQNAGVKALQQADLKAVLAKLAREIDERADEAKRADASANTVPTYNPRFTGRLEELIDLRTLLTDNRAGVIVGLHGLGGIGKTELAYTYAHAYASVYPGGRFAIPCEYQTNLRDAVIRGLGEAAEFRTRITDQERLNPTDHLAAIQHCLRQRLTELGSVLLVLDNVTDLNLLAPQETDTLTVLGPRLHLLATTRRPVAKFLKCLTLGEMKRDDALALLEKFKPFANDAERGAAESIVRQLGGFALALELVAAKLAVATSMTYAGIADGLGLDDLDTLAEQTDVMLRRHNHEKRLQAVLGPTLTKLPPEERRTLEYAALLPPDNVPLPWLRTLVTADYPALAKVGKWGDPWEELVARLVALGLFSPVQEETTATRQIRVHRLVQELIRRGLTPPARAALQERIDALVTARDAALETTTNWVAAAWELDPLEALAQQWDEEEHPDRVWLCNQVATRFYGLAAHPRAEPLMRRALALDEASFGHDHPDVAIDLNNLASLLQATNRLGEAEPLMRRALVIYILFQLQTGHAHPHVQAAIRNYTGLLKACGRTPAQIDQAFQEVVAEAQALAGGTS